MFHFVMTEREKIECNSSFEMKVQSLSLFFSISTAMQLAISFKEVAPLKRGVGIALKFANECSINGKPIRSVLYFARVAVNSTRIVDLFRIIFYFFLQRDERKN